MSRGKYINVRKNEILCVRECIFGAILARDEGRRTTDAGHASYVRRQTSDVTSDE
jgi:hypothetical protein